MSSRTGGPEETRIPRAVAGLFSPVLLPLLLVSATASAQEIPDSAAARQGIEFLPLLSYDSNTGIGYGVKLFLFDRISAKESFDFILFQSTKGERVYSLTASFPDVEARQRTTYPIALDVFLEYSRSGNANYFGIGNGSLYGDGETYTRTPIESRITAGRGFTRTFVGQCYVRYGSITNSGINSSGHLAALGGMNTRTARFVAAGLSARYDTRNSTVNPSSGIVLSADGSWAPRWSTAIVAFTRTRWYARLYVPFYGIIIAGRLGAEQINGTNLPVQVLLSLGGADNLRGYSQDRFRDRAFCIMNIEARATIVWRIGAVVGWDAGRVSSSLSRISTRQWAGNPTAGLRLIMDNFVARLDVGFSNETTGLYLNFGQLF